MKQHSNNYKIYHRKEDRGGDLVDFITFLFNFRSLSTQTKSKEKSLPLRPFLKVNGKDLVSLDKATSMFPSYL